MESSFFRFQFLVCLYIVLIFVSLPMLFLFSYFNFCKEFLSVLHLKTWKKFVEEVEVAECSVCQFVKSNCLIGFDQGDGWFGADRRNSELGFTKKDKLRRDHSYIEGSLRYWDQILRISLKDWGYHWEIHEITWVWRPGSQIGGRPCSCRCSCTIALFQIVFWNFEFNIFCETFV